LSDRQLALPDLLRVCGHLADVAAKQLREADRHGHGNAAYWSATYQSAMPIGGGSTKKEGI
jgi:hypothetical protein